MNVHTKPAEVAAALVAELGRRAKAAAALLRNASTDAKNCWSGTGSAGTERNGDAGALLLGGGVLLPTRRAGGAAGGARGCGSAGSRRGGRRGTVRARGALGPLIDALAGLPVRDLEVEKPRLEDVLISYYREGTP